MKVCAVAAQPGHTKDLQSVQLERGLRIVDSPGVIFDDDDHIQGQKESSVLLRNIVKSEDVDDPISVGRSALLCAFLRDLNSRPLLVEEILARTQTERLMKIYDLPTFSSTLEFLTMLALSTGRLLKASPIPSPPFLSFKTQTHIFLSGWYSRHPRRGATSTHRLEPSKNTVLLRTTRVARSTSTVYDFRKRRAGCSGRRVDRPRTDRERVQCAIHA
jgi:ribosome biogenesis GTPase A